MFLFESLNEKIQIVQPAQTKSDCPALETSHVMRKTVFRVSDQVQLKLCSTTTGDRQRPNISDSESKRLFHLHK